ncbi:ABC transporter permease [Microbacterium sp. X-17]|uniref:ABC transporter permease n=1 Tax=Microbacterium sp. X-17 TaxID=3144404 RepID=UPI0031F5843F
MTVTLNSAAVAVAPPDAAKEVGILRTSWRAVLRSPSGRFGLILLGLMVLIAIVGPFISPHSQAEVVGRPFEGPSATAWLGTESLGRDVLSRYLNGGWLLIATALLGTALAYLIGIPIALLAAYRRGRPVDQGTRAISTIFYAIPPTILALVLISAFGRGFPIIVAAIVLMQLPPIIHIFRGFALGLVANEYVEAAVARGESTASILVREIAPNLRGLFAADVGLRFCWSVLFLAAISFLGFGRTPPDSDWGLMISENRYGITTQPLSVIVPALSIALLTIGLTLVAESVARAVGREGMPRA